MILGAAAGDIVGEIYEFNNLRSEEFPLFAEESTFTDDTVMTYAVADALLRAFDEGEPISTALIECMREYGRRHPMRGYGFRFDNWLHSDRTHPEPYNSWGNGSAMRVSPAAWVCSTLESVEFVAAETAKVTHNHPEGIRGAQATASCIYLARIGTSNDDIRTFVSTRYGYDMDFTLDQIRPTYEFVESCQGSVPQAIEAFLESDGFEDAIRKAISIGGDSDTIGAIAASIAQGRYGVPDEIEAEVRPRLTSDLLAINDRFCERFEVGL